MAVFCGDMKEITCKTNGSTYRFEPKANESFNIDKGGIRNNDDANQIGTQGTMLIQKNRARGKIDGPILASAQVITDLNTLTKSFFDQEWTFVHINGSVYRSLRGGIIVGDLQVDSNAGTITLMVAAGEFEEIKNI
jgi:hypothetical protein